MRNAAQTIALLIMTVLGHGALPQAAAPMTGLFILMQGLYATEEMWKPAHPEAGALQRAQTDAQTGRAALEPQLQLLLQAVAEEGEGRLLHRR